MNEMYLRVEWPDYQLYMHHEDFYELSGYDPYQNAYYIPVRIIDEVEADNYPDEVEYEGIVFDTKKDFKKGDRILVEDSDGNRSIITCIAKGGRGLPDLFDDDKYFVGLNCYIIGVE